MPLHLLILNFVVDNQHYMSQVFLSFYIFFESEIIKKDTISLWKLNYFQRVKWSYGFIKKNSIKTALHFVWQSQKKNPTAKYFMLFCLSSQIDRTISHTFEFFFLHWLYNKFYISLYSRKSTDIFGCLLAVWEISVTAF